MKKENDRIKFNEQVIAEVKKEQAAFESDAQKYKNSISEELEKNKAEIMGDLASTKKPNKIKNFINRLFQTWG